MRRIEQTQLFVNVIDPQTPGKVKYDIGQHFFQAMDNAFYLFGNNAFRKASYANKAFFLGISRVFQKKRKSNWER